MDFKSNIVQKSPRDRPRRSFGRASTLLLFTLSQPLLLSWSGLLKEQPIKAAYRKHPYRTSHNSTSKAQAPTQPSNTASASQAPNLDQVDGVFFKALAKAGQCHQCADVASSGNARIGITQGKAITFQKKRFDQCQQIRHLHEASAPPRPRPYRTPLTRDECLRMVDFYADAQSAFEKPKPRDIVRRISTPPSLPSRPQRGISITKDLCLPPAIKASIDQAASKLRHPDCTHREAWEAYSSLPSPGIEYLTDGLQRLLLTRLSIIEKKDRESMFRYMSVMDDMKICNLPLKESEWNTGIAFAAHTFGRIDGSGVESALVKWKEMEQQAGVKSGCVTFNILFSAATRAEKFVLAEMILKEMAAREIPISRYCRTAIIYYHGVKGDGDGVRKAYRELVEAGEIVDTVVMNCVIVSLCRAGELAAAEHVYEGMKRTLERHTGRRIPYLDWREPRDAGRVLELAARKHKKDPEELRKVQEEQFLAPSPQTFSIFIDHHVFKTGELRRIALLLAEMERLDVPLQGRIFVKIFKGFCNHGGIRYSAWTKSRLESVWNALLTALDQRLENVVIDGGMIIWAVRAFEKCFGQEATLHIWEELRRRWKGDFHDLSRAQDVLQDILKGDCELRLRRKEHRIVWTGKEARL
ncbi:uncharacterized protein KY384_006902 [Bacidia gigantensis]|uniref:uncharacterized protein n=1 Tax=Bacidia gigantensis TaxID=2732470 RepID=UPI001D0514D5|nr:uncharacterized protein KY384_006902 [Bacidia gigantensis]KAG8527986.1 hypothetical protein KY384_006902 [Bacidia gigantensis]